MLIGRVGHFILKAPFNKLNSAGLNGRIVSVSYVKHLVSRGVNVEQLVYLPVAFTAQYPKDFAANVIIVTIADSSGTKFNVPDIYIENLYDDNSTFVDAFVTVRFGQLPLSSDFTYIRNQVAKEASKFSGVQVKDTDVSISISDKHHIYDHATASNLTDVREAKISNLSTDYGKYIKSESKVGRLTRHVESLQNKLKHYIKF